ncbi:protein ECERIFERUM 2-like [Carya illinoinensis]|uniref:Uncharacterized protein n=1 Tax=Carya illinoinensis TaxID=32201 RepID=A0A8T1PT44_CARIL|nr:protein ECERIFERUM 2-like [Carya illinoinensis]KAG6644457.1 hypothetical protein CIPAW_08G056000 [Carya illinoinensis]KAG6699213.1 hypothetical protein I3842_08G057000 [Carya illinoinensis]
MGSENMGSLVSNFKLSSVVPATVTGENKVHELTHMDLAMKLHYIQGVYFFRREAVEGLSILDLKEPMFQCLDHYFTVSGRVRRSETGRPFIKCNDSGVRIVEADCDTSIEEFLAMKYHCFHGSLVYNQVLGPDLAFSPLVIIQFTRFKCGGMSLGLSWAHVLGDAFSASAFINMWGQILSGHEMPPKSLQTPNPVKMKFPPPSCEKSVSMKRVDPLGDDHWLTVNDCNMETDYFPVTAKQLEHMVTNICADDKLAAQSTSHFAVLSAVIWKYISETREDLGPRIVTVCTSTSHNGENGYPTNGMVLMSMVEADFSVAKADVSAVVELISQKIVEINNNNNIGSVDEEILVEKGNGEGDFITYGANLTFVNLEETNIYGLELKGHWPVFANYTINGVGDEGVVLVLPGPTNGQGEGGGHVGAVADGVTVTMVLPKNQLGLLKSKLERDWNIV